MTCHEPGPEFVEFEVTDAPRFEDLRRVFGEIRRDKDAGEFRSDQEWVALFDDEARSHFAEPEGPRLDDRWDLLSLFDAFQNGEYELRTCERSSASTARITFHALAFPYGGVECMVALIEAFGGRVTTIDDGTGPCAYER